MNPIERYEQSVQPARQRFAADPAVRLIQDRAIGASHLEAFLIHFSALGVAMTEPVEGWIRRAGEACVAAGGPGLAEIGTALQKHATGEADHHLLMIADLRRLCARRATAGRPVVDPDDLLGMAWPDSALHYRRMHEDLIAGPTPYAQIAVENEIELLSVEVGPGLLANARALLGPDNNRSGDILDDLSFLTDHVTLDVAHTKFNRRQMATFLDTRPDALEALVDAGAAALDAYRAFVVDCVALAGRLPTSVS